MGHSYSIQDYLLAQGFGFDQQDNAFKNSQGVVIPATDLPGKDIAYFQNRYGIGGLSVLQSGAAQEVPSLIDREAIIAQVIASRSQSNAIRGYIALSTASAADSAVGNTQFLIAYATGKSVRALAKDIITAFADMFIQLKEQPLSDEQFDEAIMQEFFRRFASPPQP